MNSLDFTAGVQLNKRVVPACFFATKRIWKDAADWKINWLASMLADPLGFFSSANTPSKKNGGLGVNKRNRGYSADSEFIERPISKVCCHMLAGMRLSHPLHQLLIESCGATVQDDFWCQISSVGSPVMFKNLGLFFWIFKNIPHKIRISHSSRERFSAFVISEKSEFPNFRLSYSNGPKCTDSVNFRCTGVLTLVQNRSPHTQTYIRIKYKPQQIWKKILSVWSPRSPVTIWKRPLCMNAIKFSDVKNNAFCQSNISELKGYSYCSTSVSKTTESVGCINVRTLSLDVYFVPKCVRFVSVRLRIRKWRQVQSPKRHRSTFDQSDV